MRALVWDLLGALRQRAWDFWAPRYDRLWLQEPSLEPTRRAILAALPRQGPLALLDVGCGTGQLYHDLRQRFAHDQLAYVGIDPSAGMIREARAKHPEARFQVVSANDFTAPDGSFDVIVGTHAFPYVADQRGALVRFARLLRPGGLLLLAHSCHETLFDVIKLASVKLTTSAASYPTQREMIALAGDLFDGPPRVEQIPPRFLVPTLLLFRWTKAATRPAVAGATTAASPPAVARAASAGAPPHDPDREAVSPHDGIPEERR